MSNFAEYKLKISNFSPLHIGMGSDEDYTPFNSIIKDNVLINFDTLDLAGLLTDKEKFQLNNLVKDCLNPNGSSAAKLLKIREFIADKDVYVYEKAKKVVPVTTTVQSKYNANINKAAKKENQVINDLAFTRTYYNKISHKAVIPGSSIKGAIRTALLNYENAGDKRSHDRKKANALEKELLHGSFQTDPMRLISVADTSSMNTGDYGYDTVVGFVLNVAKKFKDKASIPIRVETIAPMREHSFDSSITIQNVGRYHKDGKTPNIEYSIKTIVKACNNFYLNILKDEFARLEDSEYINEGWKKVARSCLSGNIAREIEAGRAFVLRVGRFSGSEAITIDGARKINRYEEKEQSKTMGLYSDSDKPVENMFPMGWVVVQLDNSPSLAQDFTEIRTDGYKQSFTQSLVDFAKIQQNKVDAVVKQRQLEQQKTTSYQTKVRTTATTRRAESSSRGKTPSRARCFTRG